MADINTYAPKSGNIIGADNEVHNIVDLLGGGTPVDNLIYDINQFSPQGGLVIGSDSRLYDVTQLITNAEGAKAGAMDAQRKSEAAQQKSEQAQAQTEVIAASISGVVTDAKEATKGANTAAQTALDAVDDLATTALRTSASKWAFHADGNPVMVNPAAGSPMQIVADRDCAVWLRGQNWFSSEMELGSIDTSTGGIVSSSNSIRTKNFIRIRPESAYVISNDKSYTVLAFFYDENQTFISYLPSTSIVQGKLTTPINTTWIKFRTQIVAPYQTDLSVKLWLNPETALPYTPYEGGSYPATANVPIEIKAATGPNYFMADNSAYLRVGFNRDSMDMLTDLTIPVSATGHIAQIDGLIGGLPLDVTVRAVATGGGGTLDAPIPIIPAPNPIRLVRTGKNLASRTITYKTASTTVQQLQTGFRVTSMINAASSRYVCIMCINHIPPVGTELTLSAIIKASGNNQASVSFRWLDATGQRINISLPGISSSGHATYTVPTPPVDAVALGLILYVASSTYPAVIGDYVEYTDLQVEIGSTATAYESFGHSYPVPVSEPLYGLPGAEDWVNLRTGNGARGSRLLTLIETAAWAYPSAQPSNTTLVRFTLAIAGIKIGNVGRCEELPWIYQTTSTANTEAIGHSDTSAQINLFLLKSRLSASWDDAWTNEQKIVALKAWVSNNPLNILYALATPQAFAILPVIAPDRPGLNTVYSDTGGDTTVTAQMGLRGYKAQTEARMDIMQSQLTALQAKIMIP